MPSSPPDPRTADPLTEPLPFTHGDELPKQSVWDRLRSSRLAAWARKERETMAQHAPFHSFDTSNPTRPPRHVVPGLPRPATFKRVDSERRERLLPLQPDPHERRQLSATRRRAHSAARPETPKLVGPRPKRSAPNVGDLTYPLDHAYTAPQLGLNDLLNPLGPPPPPIEFGGDDDVQDNFQHVAEELPPDLEDDARSNTSSHDDALDERAFQNDLENRWILNLSMTFRDKSHREKFFVTYAETPTHWRRLTISCDYRDAPPDSLEADLQDMTYQRDKSATIYRAIRESLPDIKFFPTVTNLKLQTTDDRLHVHVTEDVNEIINYPDVNAIRHLDYSQDPVPHFTESQLSFSSHLSGFVYRVDSDGRQLIKKEIPGPDMVDEFLYEINALAALRTAPNIINLAGIVTDEQGIKIKGLLIEFAELGALVDIMFDAREDREDIAWKRRCKWARQVVKGLAAIHDNGFVQGDFTLSNIVVDGEDNAQIIDINRRGCPVGWEPPEFKGYIRSGQRVGMYIGVKSDIYQLGMVLFGIAQHNDEPENLESLSVADLPHEVPAFFSSMIAACLSDNPVHRPSAHSLLRKFPDERLDEYEDHFMVSNLRLPGTVQSQPSSELLQQEQPADIEEAHAVPSRDDIEEYLQTRPALRTPEIGWVNVDNSESNTHPEASPQSPCNAAPSSKTSVAPPSNFSSVEADDLRARTEKLVLGGALPVSVFPNQLLSTATSGFTGSRIGNLYVPQDASPTEDMESRPETLREPHSTSVQADEAFNVLRHRMREDELDQEIKSVSHHDSGFDEEMQEAASHSHGQSELGQRMSSHLVGIGAHASVHSPHLDRHDRMQ